jgi:hypothetical protein
MATKKKLLKKTIAKKVAKKKIISRKKSEKKLIKKAKIKSPIAKDIVAISTIDENTANSDCMCMQKKPNGKFYSFRLQQGRWVQSSAIPYPTKEICEDASC